MDEGRIQGLELIKFSKLTIHNYGPIADAEIELADQGLVLIRGDNRDTTAADSNGAGKSHILRALTWGVFGNDGDAAGDIIRKGTKGTLVRAHWYDSDPLKEVYLERTKGLKSHLAFYSATGDISGPTIKDTQADVCSRLGMDLATWRTTVLYAQGDLTRFADPDTTDSERKDILSRILRLEVLGKARQLASSRASERQSIIDKNARTALVLVGNIARLDVSKLKADIDAKTKKRDELRTALGKRARLTELAKEIEAHLAEIANDKAALEALRRQYDEQRRKTIEISVKADSLARSLAKSNQHLRELQESGSCPTCGASSTSKSVLTTLAALKQQIEAEGNEIERLNQELDLNTDGCEMLREQISEAESELPSESVWRKKLSDVNAEYIALERVEHDLTELSFEINVLKSSEAEMSAERNKLMDELAEIERLEQVYKQDLQHFNFWVKGFGNAGLPSMLMDSILPELTDRANHYLDILSDGDLKLAFDTESQLKSGEMRDKFTINLNVEGAGHVRPSGGQRKKITIATDLALMDLVAAREKSAIDLLLLDEVLDGLDATGKSRVIDLLSELRKARGSIFVVSHDPGLAELFEKEIVVVKEKGESRVETT